MSPERSRYYAHVDTGLWTDFAVAIKAIERPETLTESERAIWEADCLKFGLDF